MEPVDSVYEKAPPYVSPPEDVPSFVSEADYWQFYYEHPDESYEWNNGKLEKKPMSDKLSYLLYKWFFSLLGEYLDIFPEGESMGQEIGFTMDFDDKRIIRKPDLAIIHRDNPNQFGLRDRTYKGICDICIEFLSDSTKQEKERDTIQKKTEYANAGVQEYFILDGKHKETAFYRLAKTNNGPSMPLYQAIDANAGIIRSQVLPNFAFRLEHLHSLPNFKSLVEDPVYQPFILKSLQEARQAKERALKIAEQERQAKERALKKAEEERQAKEAALAKSKQERLAREAMEAELKQLRAQIPKT